MQQLTKQFGKIKVSLPIPHLLNLQVDSYNVFLQEGRKDRDPEVGLEGVFRSVFPIEDFNRTASLEYLGYEISEPKYDQYSFKFKSSKAEGFSCLIPKPSDSTKG